MTSSGAQLSTDMQKRISDRLFSSLFGKPIVSNAVRGSLVEAIIAEALEPDWRWCADGWGSFDFEAPDGTGLEVKQSAARQPWHNETSRPCAPKFDIAERTGYWDRENKWIAQRGRAAAIYVFSHHPVFDPAKADHRDPFQWDFYVAAASALPAGSKTITLQRLTQFVGVRRVAFNNLSAAIRDCCAEL